jgi:pimeloyl-ACP methyl ester carboxylesterase
MLRLLLTRPRTAVAIAGFGVRGVVPASAALRRGDTEAALGHIGRAVLGRKTFERLSALRLQQARDNLIPAELLGSGFSALDIGALRRIEVPTLLLEGQCSPRLFHRLNDRLARLLPDVRRTRIASASHIVHEDNPAAWLAEVSPFLALQGRAEARVTACNVEQPQQAT